MIRYSPREKQKMATLHLGGLSLGKVAKIFSCAASTVFYASYPDKYEAHKAHLRGKYRGKF